MLFGKPLCEHVYHRQPWRRFALFIHILRDSQRIIDPEGHECAELETAGVEACQSPRELMAQELQLAAPPRRMARSDRRRRGYDIRHHQLQRTCMRQWYAWRTLGLRRRQLFDDVRDTILQGRARRAGVRASIAEAHGQLRTLARLNAALAKGSKRARTSGGGSTSNDLLLKVD